METYINKKTDSYTEIEKYIDLEAFRDSVPEFFKDSHDPRSRDNCDYPLSALMVIMLMAVISGANSILAIFDYAVSKQSLIKELLGLEKIPKYGTFWWLITRMKPEQFSSAFYEWVKTEGIAGIPKAIQIDGKTIRGAKNKEGNQNVHLVHAWAIQKRYYISDLMESAESFGKSIKDHWSVENPLHWVMDVVFREDESRANILHAAENLGTLRRIALNLLNYNKMTNGEFSKLGTAQKRRRIGWGDSSILKEIIYPIFGQLV